MKRLTDGKRGLSWTPVRRGKFYCSPACSTDGFCTWAAYVEAQRHADAMVKELGPRWKPDLTENIGWHVAVVDETGLLRVLRHRDCRYSATIENRWWADAKTPRAAVVAVMNEALAGARKIAAVLGRLGMPVRIAEMRHD